MFGVGRDDTHIVDAIQKSQGTIEFTLDGKIITANENFLALMGYELSEVKGKHHSMFVAKDYVESSEYAEFWQRLGAGEFFTAEFHRVGKGGKDVWIQATYCPVLNRNGKPYKVFKFASDITADKRQKADYAGQIAAIGKSQAVIEFDMDGTILSANQNFLDAVGYQLDEIVGKHHRIFVGREYANSAEYEQFWKTLRAGNYTTGEYQRFGKNNKEVWIQASYNPIMDLNGRPFKVVKYAADITQDKLRAADYAGQIAAIGKSQAVIEFDMDGTIIDANENFLNAMGYTLADLKGNNHSMCVMPEYAQSDEYAAFWAALRRGEYQTGEFKRMGRGGKEVWISASYNPVFDMNGRPFKVVKYATDVTKQVMTRHTAEELAEGSTASAEAVASASEEMLAAIQEISESMHRSQIAVNDIVAKSEMADGIRDELETTSEAMTGVVQIIRELADQVNLLALNATIEAARAGDAGKGFAVVAGEVKSLATQTAKATDQIETQINSMLGITQRVVESTRQISESANSVSDYVNTVASAVEEQTGVTNDISKNIQFVFNGIGELNRCVKSIAG
ncbi:methyl-accepting chemotaxis protein [Thalassospira lucentensis]|uniref:methyl-accepting chemotaxis protein n=1 Tax=Thalassospira lucentensis TaxID=168935 RepID=UPI00142E901E|nr:PAS domain-containing methyl-accepting chemotaxis protein [Thalassospira lucentensis]NIZ01504.1 PAS domain-containing protein [Thalassospira lucentensis]